MPSPEVSTRSRIITESMRLFAEDGIKATTIARIEDAVGLRPGTGGVHRYFATKDDLVRAVLEAHLATTEELSNTASERFDPSFDDPEEFLLRFGEFVLAEVSRSREGSLIYFREGKGLLERFPDLRQRNLESALRPLADMLSQKASTDIDADALAFLMIGPLTYHRSIEWLTGETPLGISDERLVAQWASTFAGFLGSNAGT